MSLTHHQGDEKVNHARSQDSARRGPDADAGDNEQDMFVNIMGEIGRLREENDDLRCRVRRLEVRSGRGIMHPSEFSDGMTPRSA